MRARFEKALDGATLVDVSAKAMRQPICWPSNVPAGTPSDSANGDPTIATAIARPCSDGTTMRAA